MFTNWANVSGHHSNIIFITNKFTIFIIVIYYHLIILIIPYVKLLKYRHPAAIPPCPRSPASWKSRRSSHGGAIILIEPLARARSQAKATSPWSFQQGEGLELVVKKHGGKS